MRIKEYFAHPAVVAARTLAAELGIGLGSAWLVLSALELIRRGLASLSLDLNMLLAASVIAWLLGNGAQAPAKRQQYVSTLVFAILLAVLAWKLSQGQPYHAYSPLLGLAALIRLVP